MEAPAASPKQESLSQADYVRASCVAVVYFTFVCCRNFVFVLSASYTEDLKMSNEEYGQMIVFNAGAQVLGFGIHGVLIGVFGGLKVYVANMILTALCTLGCGMAPNPSVFTILVAINGFATAGGWPCSCQLIYDLFSSQQFSMVLVFLSIGSRCSAVAIALILGGLLEFVSWRVCCFVCVGIMGVGMFLALTQLTANKANPGAPAAEQPPATDAPTTEGNPNRAMLYLGWFGSLRFQVILVASSAINISGSFDTFVPLFMKDTLPSLSEGTMARMGSVIPLGILIGLAVSGWVAEEFPARRQRATLTIVLCWVQLASTLAVLGWTLTAEAGPDPVSEARTDLMLWVVVLFLLIDGATLAYPWYIPPTVFSAVFAKKETGMNQAIMCVTHAVVAGVFTHFGSSLSTSGWRYVWMLLSVLGCISVAGYTFSEYLEVKAMEEESGAAAPANESTKLISE